MALPVKSGPISAAIRNPPDEVDDVEQFPLIFESTHAWNEEARNMVLQLRGMFSALLD
jgi:hypothetical protein